jgi:hypothetical protein
LFFFHHTPFSPFSSRELLHCLDYPSLLSNVITEENASVKLQAELKSEAFFFIFCNGFRVSLECLGIWELRNNLIFIETSSIFESINAY